MAGCVSDNGNNKPNNGNGKGDEIMFDTGIKAEIEADIEAHWKEYGYKEKPKKFVAISFDDGPCPPSNYGGTAAMLAKLDELKVKADGYGSLGGETSSVITANLNAASLAIKEITGENPVLFRAPNLNHGDNLSQACKKLGMALIDGSAHNDWPGSASAIKNSVLSSLRDGGIILLHDNNTSQGNTMSVLPEIVKGLRDKGFWILTVGQLAAVKEKKLEAGKRYGAFN